MSNINISVTEQDPINVSIASPEVQNVDVTGQSISATVTDGDKGDIVVTGNGTVWTLDPNALATRVPYIGATQDVNLGEFGLLTGNLEFDTTPTNAPTGAGSMVWNDTEGTVDLVLKGGSLVLPIGQKQVIRAVNGTGGNLTRVQYRAVKITGAQGQRLQISLARADNDANSKDTIGIVGEDISNNQTGFIVSSGLIEEINTTGSLQGETWADGDTLYLSGTTYGVITNVKPAAPVHTVILGFVVYAHSLHGKIYVKIDNGYELTELHDVNTLTAASGDYLRYNGTTWVDATISAADLPSAIDATKIGAGLVTNTEFGYLDGVTSAIQTQLNGKQATLTNPVTGMGVSGQVSFFNGTSTVTGDNGLFWDNTNKRLGVGTVSPALKLHVEGGMRVRSANAQILEFTNDILYNYGGSGNYWQYISGADYIIANRTATGALTFGTNSTERMRITAAGRLLIGTTTESTYLLDVAGDIRNTTSAYFATSSGGVGIGTTTLNANTTFQIASTVVAARIASSGQYRVVEAISTNATFNDSLYYGAITRAKNGAYNAIYIGANAGSDAIFQVTGLANVGISVTGYGTSATNTFAIGSGTAPSTSITDGFQLYSADITAGNAAPHFRTEGGAVVKLYQQTTGVGAATFVANSGTAVNDASTFDGYTLNQIVKALRNAGFLA